MDEERIDRFVVMGPLAEGGGQTWLASDSAASGARVVLKLAAGEQGDALRREARWMQILAHPGLAPVVDVGGNPDQVWLAIHYVEGRDLHAVRRAGGLDAGAARFVLGALAATLAYIHAFGVAHGDLSPTNVRLDGRGEPILLDFGSVTPFGQPVLRTTTAYNPSAELASPAFDTFALGRVMREVVRPGDDDLDRLLAAMTATDAARRPSLADVLTEVGGGRAPAMSATVDGSFTAGSAAVPASIGRYRVERELGRGGMGVVYAAYDPALRRRVAIKLGLFGEPRRFLREAHAAGRLEHPAIVRVLDAGESESGPFLAMELVEGPTLATLLRDAGPIPPGAAGDLVRAIADALAHAHARGVVHRDVKPANVLLAGSTSPKLADFGLAAVRADESGALTRTGAHVGTPRYTAPEVLRGQESGIAVDIWGLGLLLFEALIGRPAFDGPNAEAVHARILGDEPVSPRLVDPRVPVGLDRVVRKATARRPQDRYVSMSAMIADLDRQVAGRPVVVPPRVWGRETAAWLRRRATSIAAAGLVAGAALALTAWGTALYLQEAEHVAREGRAAEAWRVLRPRLAAARAEGQSAQAAATLEAFVSLPDHRGTAALARVWLDEAEARWAAGDRGGAREAWSRAWFEASDAGARGEALRGLGGAAREDGRWNDLVAILAVARSAGVSDPGGALGDWEREAVWLRGSPPQGPLRAASAEPVVAALLQDAHRTPWAADKLLAMRVDGRRAWALSRDDQLAEVVGDGSADLPVVAASLGVRAPAVPVGRTAGARLILSADGQNRLMELEDGAWVERHAWSGSRPSSAMEADLDGDGRREWWVGVGPYDRRLLTFHPDPSGIVQMDPHPPTSATRSDVVALDHADLDGDGTPEVVVVMGPWGAFDVRVFSAGSRTLTFAGRRKMGSLRGLALLPDPRGGARVLVNVTEQWASKEQFPPDSPAGEPRGARLLAWRDGTLQVDATMSFPALCKGWVVGDFDGDGVADAVTDCSGDMGVVRQDRSGRVTTAVVPRVVPRAVGQLDADAADELLVNLHRDPTQAVWALGVGQAHIDTGVLAPESVPSPIGGEVGARWQRAEDLLAMGQIEEAILTFRAVADLARAPAAAGAALRRAARALEAREACERATPLWEAAANRDPARASRDLSQVVQCSFRQYRWADTLAGLDRLLSRSDLEPEVRAASEATRAELVARGVGAPVVLDFSAGLPVGVHVTDPLAVREARSGLAFSADRAEIARIPLTWDGRALSLSVDLDLERMEWASGFYVTLQPVDRPGDRYGVGLKALGGGGVVRAHLRAPWGPTDRHDVSVPRSAAAEERAITLTYDADGEAGRWFARARGLRDGDVLLPSGSEVERPQPGRYDLVIEARPEVAGHPVIAGVLRAVRIVGARPIISEETEIQREARALTSWRPTGVAGSSRAFFRFVAADDAGDGVAAARAIADLIGDEEVVRRLVRARPASVLPLLTRLAPDRWLSLLWGAWESAIRQHLDDAQVEAFLLERTAPVERAAPNERAGASGEAWFQLLMARARVAVRNGRLDRAAELLALAREGGSNPDLWLAEARLAAARGQTHLALAAIEQAVNAAPSPTVFADRAAADPAFRALHAHPGWAQVRAAQAGFPSPDPR